MRFTRFSVHPKSQCALPGKQGVSQQDGAAWKAHFCISFMLCCLVVEEVIASLLQRVLVQLSKLLSLLFLRRQWQIYKYRSTRLWFLWKTEAVQLY